MSTVCIFVPGLGGIRGGAEASSIKLASYLSGKGLKVTLVADCSRLSTNYTIDSSCSFFGLPYKISFFNLFHLFANLRALRDFLKYNPSSKFICVGLPACIFYLICFAFKNNNYIYVEHTVPEFYKKKPLLSALAYHCILRSRIFCTVSQQARIGFQNCFGIDSFVLPNPLQMSSRSQLKVRRQAQNTKMILICGRLVSSKRPFEACKAFLGSGLISKGWTLCYVGQGKLYTRLYSYIKRQSASRYITMLGQLDSIQHLYSEAAYLLHCSLYESLGLAILEAMSFGTIPIIRDNLYSTVDICSNENTIFYNTNSLGSEVASIQKALLYADSLFSSEEYSSMSQSAIFSYQEYIAKINYEKAWHRFAMLLME